MKNILICVLLWGGLSGCDWIKDKAKDAVDGGEVSDSVEQYCDPKLPGTPGKIPNPKYPTSCIPPILLCNYCEYKSEMFIGGGSEACGVSSSQDVP